MTSRSKDSLLKIAEFGLAGDKLSLVTFLKKLASYESSRKHFGVYNDIINLIENHTEKKLQITSTSSIDNSHVTNYVDHVEDIWLPERLRQKIDKFITLQEKKVFSLRGVHNLNKLLLYGPPGSGKTTLGFYIAKKLGRDIRYVKLGDIISSRLGETTKNIEDIFRNGQRQVIFIDEFDALAKKRTDNNDVGELKRVVNSIIQTLDFHANEHIVIVSTNLIDTIDSAILRRFGYKLNIDHLDAEQFREFFQYLISRECEIKVRLNSDEKKILGAVASLADLNSIDDVKLFFDKTVVSALLDSKKEISLKSFITTLFDEDYIGQKNIKSLRRIDPSALSILCKYLEANDYPKTKISNLLGIHRNSYKKYVEEV